MNNSPQPPSVSSGAAAARAVANTRLGLVANRRIIASIFPSSKQGSWQKDTVDIKKKNIDRKTIINRSKQFQKMQSVAQQILIKRQFF